MGRCPSNAETAAAHGARHRGFASPSSMPGAGGRVADSKEARSDEIEHWKARPRSSPAAPAASASGSRGGSPTKAAASRCGTSMSRRSTPRRQGSRRRICRRSTSPTWQRSSAPLPPPKGARQDRHPRQQRRHQRPGRADLGVSAGGVGPGARRRPHRRLLLLPCGGAGDAHARLRPHRQCRVDRRQGRQSRHRRVRGGQGRRDRLHQVARARAGRTRACSSTPLPRSSRRPTCSVK